MSDALDPPKPSRAETSRSAGSLRSLGHGLGIDRAVLLTLVTRAWSLGAGLVTIVVVTRALSPQLQGYYYTFYSLIALQIFVELGLNYAIVQFSSHEMARLSWTPAGTLTGSEAAKRRLQSLLYFALAWFGTAATLMLVVLSPLGLYFFGLASGTGAPEVGVSAPWVLLVAFSAVNLLINALVAVLEGCGRVAEMALLRLVQAVASAAALWSLLSAGGRLYAVGAASAMMAVAGIAGLTWRYSAFFADLLTHPRRLAGLDWRREVWPFQWRIAVSFASGYLLTQLFNPLLLAIDGPVAAGQMGMSLQIIGAMNGAALAWVTTKAPTYGQLIARGQRKELDRLFLRGLVQSFGVLLVGVIVVWAGLCWLSATSRYATRVLPLPQFSLLCLACLANHVAVAQAVYLRAHKEEPFMVLSVASGVATAALTFLLVPAFGTAGAVVSYTSTTLLVGLVGGTVVFLRKRRQWAGQALEASARG